VPFLLRDIARSIKNRDKFRSLPDEEALDALMNGKDESSMKFKAFLDRHGHRGLKEIDVAILQWGEDPIKVIKFLKGILATDLTESPVKKPTIEELIGQLKTELTPMKKRLLKFSFP